MIDKKFFSQLQKEYTQYVQGRNEIIVVSRDILKFSKQAIFACHRNELDDALRALTHAHDTIRGIEKKINKNKDLEGEGSFRAALEEFTEASLLYQFLVEGTVTRIEGVMLSHEIYIGALSDFTGELTRRAVALATKRDVKGVEQIRGVIEAIMSQFITFDLLSNLRSKYDAARKNLRTVEEILYDLEMSRSRNA